LIVDHSEGWEQSWPSVIFCVPFPEILTASLS